MALVSDAAFDLDEVAGRQPERQFVPGPFSPGRAVRLLAKRRERKGTTGQRKQPTIHRVLASTAVAARRASGSQDGILNALLISSPY